MTSQEFEKGILETLRKILSTDNLNVSKRDLNDGQYVYDVKGENGTRIFLVRFSEEEIKGRTVPCEPFHLTIGNKEVHWSGDTLKDLILWTAEKYRSIEQEKEKHKNDAKIEEEQKQMMAFLGGFLPKTK